MHPTLEEVLEKLGTWRANAARVQVSWLGLATGTPDQRLLTGYFDGIVHVVETEAGGARTLVLVGSGGGNSIHMYLTEECTFQSMTFGSEDRANIADIDSGIRIAFPTGEACFVTFYRPLN